MGGVIWVISWGFCEVFCKDFWALKFLEGLKEL